MSVRLRRPKAKTLAVGLALLGVLAVGVGLLIYSTGLGAGIDTDAVNYLSAAESLARGNGYLGWDGQLLPYFPPGYPLLVALGRLLTGFRIAQVARGVDVILFAGLVIATYLLACRVISRPALRLLVTALVASSPIVLEVYGLVSSETLFNLLCVAALVVLCEIRRISPLSRTRYRATLGLLAAIASAAAVTRLVGVALVLSLAIALIVLGSPTKRLFARTIESVGFGVVALAPVIAWDFLLHSQTGLWTFGDRPPSPAGIGSNIVTAAQTVAAWPSPLSAISPSLGWVDLVAVAVVVLAVATGLVQLARTPASRLRNVAPILIFCVVYPAFLIAISSRVDLAGALDNRYLSPMLAPLVVLVGFVVELTWTRAQRSGWFGRGLAVAVTGAMALSLVSSLIVSGRDSQQRHVEGIPGVTRTDWNNMSVIRMARGLPLKDGEPLLSDVPEMVSYSTGRLYQYPPFRSEGAPEDLQNQVQSQGPAYLVLLISEETPDMYTPDELAQWFTVRLVDSSPDAQLFELSQLK